MSFKAITLAFFLVATQAVNLTCLTADVAVLPLGLFCHFKHKAFNAVEQATVDAVEQAADDAYDVGKFAVTHHPVKLAYNYGKSAGTSGIVVANHGLAQSVKEAVNVDIGFGKEAVNQVMNIVELADRADFGHCVISGVSKADDDENGDVGASEGGGGGGKRTMFQTSRKRTDSPTALSMVSPEVDPGISPEVARSLSEKFKELAQPAVFNITDESQQIGGTIAQWASFLIPVGGEEEAAAKATQGGFDLAFDGDEAATRFIASGADGTAEHLTEETSPTLKKLMGEDGFFNKACKACTAPASAARRRRRSRRSLSGALAQSAKYFCCNLSGVAMAVEGVAADFDTPDVNTTTSSEGNAVPHKPLVVYDPKSEYYGNQIPETNVTTEKDVQATNTWKDVQTDRDAILHDLDTRDTAALNWSSPVTDQISSQDVLKLLRRIFEPTTPEDIALSARLGPRQAPNSNRIAFNSYGWTSKDNDTLDATKLIGFVKAAIEQGKQAAKALRSLDDATAAALEGDVDFYFIPEGAGGVNPDRRGLHQDEAHYLQLVTEDQPGLVVQKGESLTRVLPREDAWHIIKCLQWNGKKAGPATSEATVHTVFGPEIVSHGLVSIVVNIN